MKRLFKLIILFLFLININVKAANETAITNVKVNDESINCVNLKCNATVDSDTVVIQYALIDPDATASGFKFPSRHFISKNFSAPRSAPNPASVTT